MKQTVTIKQASNKLIRLMIVMAVAISAVAFASPAAAAPPDKSEFSFSDSGEMTGVCSFPIVVDMAVKISETDFYDATGAVVKIFLHFVEQDTFSANGKSLAGLPYTFNINIGLDAEGNLTRNFSHGIAEKVPLPDGSLFVSAGWTDWMNHPNTVFLLSPDRGNPGNVAAFCAALAP